MKSSPLIPNPPSFHPSIPPSATILKVPKRKALSIVQTPPAVSATYLIAENTMQKLETKLKIKWSIADDCESPMPPKFETQRARRSRDRRKVQNKTKNYPCNFPQRQTGVSSR
ncbi:hypothetical protein AMECASPLE_022598 [Ameca splendens]|uniref:Uncharacterized protein n=1 Tax=Ameca splendens TaxID=208324 RepID=A0ABV1A1V5_9TELE